jgi:hypothetical protein
VKVKMVKLLDISGKNPVFAIRIPDNTKSIKSASKNVQK